MEYKKKIPFRRNIEDSHVSSLSRAFSYLFDSSITNNDIKKIVSLINKIEKKMVGRLAGDIEDYILNYYMHYYAALRLKSYAVPCHLEIGTLFGGSTIITLFALREAKSVQKVISVDPLDGYYLANKKSYSNSIDIITGLPLDKETVEKNISLFGFNKNSFKILPFLSSDIRAQQKLKKYSILSLFIDGDHSYKGIENDWNNYTPSVVEMGFILVDNYNDISWPDVTEFINHQVLPDYRHWAVIYVTNKSILFQRCIGSAAQSELVYSLSQSIMNYSNSIKKLEKEMKKTNIIIKKKNLIIKEKDEIVDYMQNSISWRLTGPLRRLRRLFRT